MLRRPASCSSATRTGAIYVPFYEYFHGDTGAGVGASHQTGWTALVAKLLDTTGRWRHSERGMVTDLSGSRKAPRST